MNPFSFRLSRRSVLASMLLALAACGGGGGGSKGTSTPPASGSAILITPTSDPDLLTMNATLESVEWVRADGSTTGNLLAAPVAVPVVSEAEDAVAVPVREVDDDAFVECRVRFAGGRAQGRHRDGGARAVAVDDVREHRQRIAFEHRRARGTWLEFHHREGSGCFEDGSGWHWSGGLDGAPIAGTRFHSSHIRVGSMDKARFAFTGVFSCGCGDVKAVFVVPASARLRIEGIGPGSGIVDRDRLFAAMAVGMRVKVHAVALADGTLECWMVALHPGGGNRGGDEDDVGFVAAITRLDVPAQLAEVDVLAATHGSELLERFFSGRANRRILLTLAGVPIRRAGEVVDGGIELLVVGEMVEVEVEPFPQAEPMRPTQVDVKDGGGVEIEGRVTDVQRLPNAFVFNPSTNDSLFRSGNLNSAVTVELTGSTLVYLERPNNRVAVDQIRTGQRIRVRGDLSGQATVRAGSLRLRTEHGGGNGHGGGN